MNNDSRSHRDNPLLGQYKKRYDRVLVPISRCLEALIIDHLNGPPKLPRVDRVSVRAKAPASFVGKAAKRLQNGDPRYVDPFGQIQDQIGARVIAFYKSDVKLVCERIMHFFSLAEQQTKEPESDWEFGYFGMHFILALPGDAVPRGISTAKAPTLFELQVRTLFEHAWSESEHDIVYKAAGPLTPDQLRRCAFTAAQAWGADRVFQELYDEIHVKQ